jgi:putative transposase
LVFVTKYRHGVFDDEMLTSSTTRRPSPYPGWSTPLKGVSSRHLRAEFTGQVNRAGTRGHLWSPSYLAASCGGAPLEIVKEYIRGQRRPDQEGLPPRPEGRGFRPRPSVIPARQTSSAGI